MSASSLCSLPRERREKKRKTRDELMWANQSQFVFFLSSSLGDCQDWKSISFVKVNTNQTSLFSIVPATTNYSVLIVSEHL